MLHLFAGNKSDCGSFLRFKTSSRKHFTHVENLFKIWSNRLQLAVSSEKINYMMRTPFYPILNMELKTGFRFANHIRFC